MKVVVRQSNVVRPAEETPTRLLWNSNLDLAIPRILHVTTVYFFRRPSINNNSNDFFSYDALERALARALVPFYPMAGRLLTGTDDGRIYLNCNAEGVVLLEAEIGANIDDLRDFASNEELWPLVPRYVADDVSDISSCPLLLLQVTFFKCGGVSLGVAVEHHAGDGMSSIHFINTWADIAKGKEIAQQPFIDRTLLRARDPPVPKYVHVEYQAPPTLLSSARTSSQSEVNLKGVASTQNADSLTMHGGESSFRNSENLLTAAIFHLTHSQVMELKNKAIDEVTKTKYSTFESISAHIWRCVSKARQLSGEQETKLYIATDGRTRLQPPLPPGYFGNVIFNATPIAHVQELTSSPLSVGAQRIKSAVAQMDDEYLRSALDYLQLQRNLETQIEGEHAFCSPNLNITSWTRMPIYECDFGWGRPTFMGPVGIPFDGFVFLLPSPVDDGGISVSLALLSHDMRAFEQLFFKF